MSDTTDYVWRRRYANLFSGGTTTFNARISDSGLLSLWQIAHTKAIWKMGKISVRHIRDSRSYAFDRWNAPRRGVTCILL